MPKLKTVFVCSNCGTEHAKWAGQCSSCSSWNSLLEDVVEKVSGAASREKKSISRSVSVKSISEIDHKPIDRYVTGITEFDRVIGGGIVPGSVILLGGQPGIGKSTLTLQIVDRLRGLGSIMYVAGEESVSQISLRVKRLGLELSNVQFIESVICEEVEAVSSDCDLLVVDSIQILKSIENDGVPGGISQIRAVTDRLVSLAKSKNVAMILIGHVTKDGELAGPKILEHLVDTVLYIEGDRNNNYRFIKTFKDRFGSSEDVGIFKMEGSGMSEVIDPAAEFIGAREKSVVGSALSCIMEGNRPIIIEVQALTSKSSYGYPKRSSNGFSMNRLNMIIAVLQKFFGVNLSDQDVFVNVSGGFKINDTACDLAVMKAIMSSYSKTALKHDTVYVGEIGLTGMLRKVSFEEMREKEIKRLGFKLSYRLSQQPQ